MAAPNQETTPQEIEAAAASFVKGDYDHSDLPVETDEPEVEEAEAKVEPAPAVKEAPVVEKPVESPKPSHPAALRRRAIRAGLTDQQIESLSSDELTDWVFDIQEEAAQQQRQAAPPTKEPVDEDAIDEAVAPEIATHLKRLAKENKDLRASQAKRDQFEQERAMREAQSAWDDGFEALPPELKKWFGEGDGSGLANGSKEMKRRNAVLKESGILRTDTTSAIKRKIKATANDLYGDLLAAAAPKEEPAPAPSNGTERISKEKWDAAAVNRATNVPSPKVPKSEQAAKEAVMSFYRKHDISEQSEDEQLKGVPK